MTESKVQRQLTIQTQGRGLVDISQQVQSLISQTATDQGLCHVFLPHTSASLLLNENWDQDVQSDLEAFFARLVPDGDSLFKHVCEGSDDMPAHIRTALTQSSVSIPFAAGQLLLGQWQGLYLWEHRVRPHKRKLIVTF